MALHYFLTNKNTKFKLKTFTTNISSIFEWTHLILFGYNWPKTATLDSSIVATWNPDPSPLSPHFFHLWPMKRPFRKTRTKTAVKKFHKWFVSDGLNIFINRFVDWTLKPVNSFQKKKKWLVNSASGFAFRNVVNRSVILDVWGYVR